MDPDRPSYNVRYRAAAVRLAVDCTGVASVSRVLGIGSTTLQRWDDLPLDA